MAKGKRNPDHPDNWLDGLHDENPVQRWHTCQVIQPGSGHEQRLINRLLELIFDPVDWDCNHFVAIEAYKALTRLDKTGYQWLGQVSKAIQVHNNNGYPDIAAEMIRHARSVMEPWAYIQWLSRTIPTPTRDEHWVTTLVQWLPYDWTDDEELMRHMLHAMAPADSEQVWLELCVREVLNDHTIQQNPEMLDIHIQYLSKVKKWSRQAPPQIRLLAVDEVERRYQISLAGVDRKEKEGTDPARD